eukprot:TRINITY_DN3573_c0_g1_i1.p1 TRINITY_DN3573_c0_g1~~TRINITY_DN3573_c0_g1_i1.p1  ORF type:complete len:263 (-),score=36.17 TRINITY_DN3573_c0_g1_i1:264-1052(-)
MVLTAKRFETPFKNDFFWLQYEWEGKRFVSSYEDAKIVFPKFHKLKVLWSKLSPFNLIYEKHSFKTQGDKKIIEGSRFEMGLEDLNEGSVVQKLRNVLKTRLADKYKMDENEIAEKVSQFSLPLEFSLLHLLSPFNQPPTTSLKSESELLLLWHVRLLKIFSKTQTNLNVMSCWHILQFGYIDLFLDLDEMWLPFAFSDPCEWPLGIYSVCCDTSLSTFGQVTRFEASRYSYVKKDFCSHTISEFIEFFLSGDFEESICIIA